MMIYKRHEAQHQREKLAHYYRSPYCPVLRYIALTNGYIAYLKAMYARIYCVYMYYKLYTKLYFYNCKFK